MGKSVRGTTSNDPWLSAIKDDISTPTATAAATPSASKKSSAPAADPWLSAVADDIKKKVGTTDGSNGSTPPAPSPSPSPSETGVTFDNAYNIATLNGAIQPEGTFKPKPSPVKDFIEQMKENATVENGVATIHDNSQPKSNLPDIKEAIDNAVQQKIKRDRGVDLKTPPSKYEVESATKVVTDAYKRGDLVPKVENGKAVMKRGTGFVESLVNSLDETYRANQENEYFKNLSRDEKKKYLNLNQQYPEVFQPQPETAPSGLSGQFGAFVGENTNMLAKGAVGAVAATEAAPIAAASSFGLIGTAGAGNFGSFVALAKEFGNSGYKAGYEKTYYALKQQGLSDDEAADKAEKVGLTGAVTQLGVSAVLSAAPKIDLQATEPAVSGFIDGLVKSAGGMLKKEAPKMAATSAGASLAESGAEAAVGVDVDPKKALEEAVQAGGHGALIGAAFWALHEPLRIPSYLRPQAENLLATVPVEAREDYLNKAVEQGISTEEQKIAVSKTINELGEKKTAVNDLPIPEEKKAAIAGKLVQAEKLEREKDELSKYGSSFNDKIGQIDAQISNIHEDINKMYGADDVFEHESDSLTGEKPTVKGEPEHISQPIELNPEITNGENQTATTTGDSTGQATDTAQESKTLPSNESPTPQEAVVAPAEIKPTVDESQAKSTEVVQSKGNEGTTVSNESQSSKESSPVETATSQDKQGAKEESVITHEHAANEIQRLRSEYAAEKNKMEVDFDAELNAVKKRGYKEGEFDELYSNHKKKLRELRAKHEAELSKLEPHVGGDIYLMKGDKNAKQGHHFTTEGTLNSILNSNEITGYSKDGEGYGGVSLTTDKNLDDKGIVLNYGNEANSNRTTSEMPIRIDFNIEKLKSAGLKTALGNEDIGTFPNEQEVRVIKTDGGKMSDVDETTISDVSKYIDNVQLNRDLLGEKTEGIVKKLKEKGIPYTIKEKAKENTNNDASISSEVPKQEVPKQSGEQEHARTSQEQNTEKPQADGGNSPVGSDGKQKKKVSRTKLSASIMSKADTIEKEGILPSWLKVHLPEGTQQAGFGEKELTKAFTSAMRLTAKAIDGGAALVESINEGVEHLRGVFSDNKLPFDEAAIRKGLKSEVKKLLSGKPETDFTSVRKEKLKEIEGVKKEFEKRSPISWNETYDNALRKVQEAYPNKSLYDAVRSRVNEFVVRLNNKDLFNPTSEDIAVFNVFRNQTQKRINDIEGMDSDNQVQRLAAVAEFEPLQEDLRNVARVTNPNGEAGRAFGMHQSEVKLDPDYGLKIRRMELMRSKGGEKLTPEDLKQTQEKWEREKEIMKREQEVRDKAMRDDFDARLAELKRQSESNGANKGNPQGNKAKLTVDKRKSVADFMRKSADKLENFSRAKGIEGAEIAGVDIQKAIADGMRYVADKIEEGKIKIPDIIADAVAKYGKGNEDELRNHIKNELKNAGIDDDLLVNSRESSLDKIKEFSDANKATDITNDMVGKNLIRDFVNSHIGEVDQSEILDTAAKDLKKVLPDVNKKKLIEAYLKEGEFKQPTKKDLEGGMTEAKKQLASISKLTEDIEDLNGLKEIRQRSFSTEREKSEYEKKLFDEKNAKVNEIADRNAKIKEEHRKLEAERNRQMTRISELTDRKAKLEKGIIEKTKAAEKRADTPEIEKLKAEVEAITKEIRKTESDRNKQIRSSNRKVETEINRQMTRISELTDRKAKLEQGIREKRNATKKVDTPEIENLKEQVKKADEDLRKAESEKNRLDKEARDRKDKIAELDANIKRAIADRDLIKTHKNKSPKQVDAEIEAKQRELKRAIRDNTSEERVQDKKLEDTKKKMAADIKQFERKIAEGDFEDRVPVKLKKEDAELIKLQKERELIQGEYRKMQDHYKEKNKSKLERVSDFTRSAYVAALIGQPLTLAKVGSLAILRPASEAARELLLGKVFDTFFPGISKAAKAGGEGSGILGIQKGYEAYFQQAGKEKIEARYLNAEKDYQQAAREYQDYKNTANQIKSGYGDASREYKDALRKLKTLKDNLSSKLIKAQSNIIYQFIGSSSLKDGLGSLVNRSNEIERQFGKVDKESFKEAIKFDPDKSRLNNGLSAAFNGTNYVLGFIGRSHSALKTFSGRYSFASGFMARMMAAVENGRDISNMDTMLEIAHESYIDWSRGKYQQDNAVTRLWNKGINSIEKGETGGTLTLAKVGKFVLKATVPITRVPVNVIHEAVMEYTVGAFKALYMASKDISAIKKEIVASGLIPDSLDFKAAMREEISQMDATRAATIARCFKKGGLGAGLYALAFVSGCIKFGIFPHLGQKKKKEEGQLAPDELNPGQVQVGGIKLGEVPSAVLDHIPALWPMFLGLGMAQSYHDQIQKGKTTTTAVLEAIKTHLQVIEGDIPQTKLISPTKLLTEVTRMAGKRATQMGIMSDPNKFTDADLTSPAWQLLNDKGLKPPVMQTNNEKVKVEGNKPNRNMTADEFAKFNDIRKATVEKFVNNAIKSKQKFSGKGIDGVAFYNVPIDKMTSDQLKSKLKTWEGNASKVAKAKLLAKK